MKRIANPAGTIARRGAEGRTFAGRRLLKLAWKQALADLTPGLTHDLNNALTGILGMSEACLVQIAPKHPISECLKLIREKAREAAGLIDRLARLYQDEQGQLDYHDLNSIAGELIEILRQVAPRRIEVNLGAGFGSFPVHLHGVELRRILLCLSLSAISRMPGQGKLQVRIARRRCSAVPRVFRGQLPRGQALCLAIADSGASLSPAQLRAVFEPFAASDEITAGLALYLYHAMQFVERNLGAVSVESKPRGGTTVQFWFPETDFGEGGGLARV